MWASAVRSSGCRWCAGVPSTACLAWVNRIRDTLTGEILPLLVHNEGVESRHLDADIVALEQRVAFLQADVQTHVDSSKVYSPGGHHSPWGQGRRTQSIRLAIRGRDRRFRLVSDTIHLAPRRSLCFDRFSWEERMFTRPAGQAAKPEEADGAPLCAAATIPTPLRPPTFSRCLMRSSNDIWWEAAAALRAFTPASTRC